MAQLSFWDFDAVSINYPYIYPYNYLQMAITRDFSTFHIVWRENFYCIIVVWIVNFIIALILSRNPYQCDSKTLCNMGGFPCIMANRSRLYIYLRASVGNFQHLHVPHIVMNSISFAVAKVAVSNFLERDFEAQYRWIYFFAHPIWALTAHGSTPATINITLHITSTSCGASGGCFGMVGFTVLMSQLLCNRGFNRQPNIIYAQLGTLLVESIPMAIKGENDRLEGNAVSDKYAHFLGLICGLVLACFLLFLYDQTSTETMIYIGIYMNLFLMAIDSFLLCFSIYEFLSGNSHYYFGECLMFLHQGIMSGNSHIPTIQKIEENLKTRNNPKNMSLEELPYATNAEKHRLDAVYNALNNNKLRPMDMVSAD